MDRTPIHDAVRPWRTTLYQGGGASTLRSACETAFAPDAPVHLCHPLGNMTGGTELFERAYAPLVRAFPDLERREIIAVAGKVGGDGWYGACGHYLGTFASSYLDIPSTGRLAQFRFHEFFRVENGRIAEAQAIWDLPALMMQAGAWPMGPSLGVEWMAPAPATGDGVVRPPDPSDGHEAVQLVLDMLSGLQKHAEGGADAMSLDRFWDPRFNWYGPAGIGSMRGLAGFRRDHQIPFLNALPDRSGAGETPVFFAEGDYVATTGWPNMRMTVTGDGWLGIAPSGTAITMRSLDFWRVEQGLLRENWVLIDLLHVWDQLGVDVLARMRELTFHRRAAPAS